MSFQSVHVDRSKKLYSNQAGLDSKVRAGCQNDLADLEKEKRKKAGLKKYLKKK